MFRQHMYGQPGSDSNRQISRQTAERRGLSKEISIVGEHRKDVREHQGLQHTRRHYIHKPLRRFETRSGRIFYQARRPLFSDPFDTIASQSLRDRDALNMYMNGIADFPFLTHRYESSVAEWPPHAAVSKPPSTTTRAFLLRRNALEYLAKPKGDNYCSGPRLWACLPGETYRRRLLPRPQANTCFP